MIVSTYMFIPTKNLSTVKTNIITCKMNGEIIGEVKEILEEVKDNVFRCMITIYPKYEEMVKAAMDAEMMKLTGKSDAGK